MRKIVLLALSLLAASSGCGSDSSNEPGGSTALRDGGALTDSGNAGLDARVVANDAAARDAGPPPSAAATLASSAYVGGWDWSGQPYPARVFTLTHASGALAPVGGASDLGVNPSHVAASPDGKHLYVVNELTGARAGITVARIDPATGSLQRIQQVPYADGAFVYTRVHPGGKYLFAADYYAGKLVVYRIGADGKLGDVAASASFPRKSAEESAQTHSVGIHDDGKYVYVPNKALDRVAMLTFDPVAATLTPGDDVPSPGGPRHVALYGSVAYVMHENDSHLASFRIGDDGALTPVDEASTLPDGFSGESTGAHVAVHPSGTFVYASNRGHDSIAVFATTAEGMLTRVALTPSEGKTPRAFDIDADGALLIAANQGTGEADDGSLVGFTIGSDGLLTRRGQPVGGLKSPTVVLLVPRRAP